MELVLIVVAGDREWKWDEGGVARTRWRAGGRVGVGSEVGGIVDRCEEEHRRRA